MKEKLIYSFVGTIVLVGFCFGFMNYRNNTDRLFSKLDGQIKEEKFEDLYEDSFDYIKTSLTKKQFVEKMKEAVSKMKQVDENLNFQRDKGWEKTTPSDFPKEQGFRFTVQKLTNNDISAFAIVYWDDTEFSPKFKNIIFVQSDGLNSKWSDKYEFKGI